MRNKVLNQLLFIAFISIFFSCNSNSNKQKTDRDSTILDTTTSDYSNLKDEDKDSSQYIYDSTRVKKLNENEIDHIQDVTYDQTLTAQMLRTIYSEALNPAIIGIEFSWYDRRNKYALMAYGFNANDDKTEPVLLDITFPGDPNFERPNNNRLKRKHQVITNDQIAAILAIPQPLNGSSNFRNIYFKANADAHPPTRNPFRKLMYLNFRTTRFNVAGSGFTEDFSNPCPPCPYCLRTVCPDYNP